MDRHTLQVLEFDKVLALLADRTRSEAARARALALAPEAGREAAARAIRLAGEKRSALLAGFSPPWDRLADLAPSLQRLETEGTRLDAAELVELGLQLAAGGRLRDWFGDDRRRLPLSAAQVSAFTPLPALETALAATFDEQGDIRDGASPALRTIRRERKRLRAELEETLRRLLRSPAARDALQEEIITVRNDRLVIPVRASMQASVPGIVHDLSGSGQTVFLEPLATVPVNNRLRELAREEDEEIERILQRLSAMARAELPSLLRNGDVLAEADLEFAKARLAETLRCVEPALREDGAIRLVGARHPLLLASRLARAAAPDGAASAFEEIVPLDFELEESARAVLVTGPNTGGKTVAMKTVGLLTLMAQAGLPVPAREGTELSLFRRVFADIGDEQSIELDLSTFSSHLREIAKVLREADGSTLVLLDEVGAGTDPEEGGALARAVLEGLLSRGARVVATTHHGSLKVLAHSDPRMRNASLEFDAESLRPTYRFRLGIPGSSRGLDIASRLGIPAATIERARSFVGRDRLELDSLLADLDDTLARSREERAEAGRARAEAEALREAFEEANETFRAELRERRREAREEAAAVLREARELLDRLAGEVRSAETERSQVTRDRLKSAREAVGDLRARLDRENAEERAARGAAIQDVTAPPIGPGSRVWILALDREGRVDEVMAGGRLKVEAGRLRLEVSVAEVRALADAGVPSEGAGGRGWSAPESEGAQPPELDLRGFTAEEALESLDRRLDGALLAGLPELRIIHGHGTGVLRARVRTYLGKHPRITGFRPGNPNEGGTGVTIASLA